MYKESQSIKHKEFGIGTIKKVSGNEIVVDFGKFEITFTADQLVGKVE